jgi:hypothetical protein
MKNISTSIENGGGKMAYKKHHTEEERLDAIRASKRKYQEEYRKRNPEQKNNWRINNIERVREYGNAYDKHRRKIDPVYKFSGDIRSLIGGSFRRKGSKKPIKTEKILGCSIEEFKNYIISKCPEGVTLENFSRYGYHIDHIIPLASANSEEEILKLCHFTNLQPLWCKENLIKSDKLNK